jgi:endonuclease/exonuclease/phosphatase family metal-dependent hydrolase
VPDREADVPTTLGILSFNTWLVRVRGFARARDLEARLALLPEAAAGTGADVIALQEVWSDGDRERLCRAFEALGYPHAAVGTGSTGGAMRVAGDGLIVVSRLPLGPPTHLTFDRVNVWYERFIRKGALRTSVLLPGGSSFELVNAHLGVVRFDRRRGSFDPGDLRAVEAQVDELAAWVGAARSRTLVMTADLNLDPRTSPAYRRLLDGLDLVDTFHEANPGAPPAPTFDPPGNPYAGEGDFRHLPPERIDYVLLSRRSAAGLVSSRLVLGGPRAGGGPPRLSDHAGVFARIAFGDQVT